MAAAFNTREGTRESEEFIHRMTTNILHQAGSGTEGSFELFREEFKKKTQQFEGVSFNDENSS